MKIKNLLLFGLILTIRLFSEVTLPSIFGNSMVLQQKSRVAIWGWASPGERIFINGGWNKRTVSTITDEDGKWSVLLKTPKAGGPYTISITGKSEVKLTNVMIGEVWLCSGQSNMEMWMTKGAGKDGVVNYKEEIEHANYPDIRLFHVKHKAAASPMVNCSGLWRQCNPESVSKFSAVAFYFGLELYQKLNVPIGLIHSSWGGTPAQAWTSRKALESNPVFQNYLDQLNNTVTDEDKIERLKKEYNEDLNRWILESYSMDKKIWRSWISADFDDSDWQKMILPSTWEKSGLTDFDGTVWFRKHFTVPDNFLGKELVLDLGPVDDMDRTFINGIKVGEIQKRGKWRVLREYPIPADLLVAGDNIVSIRVTDYKGSGGIYNAGDHLKIISKEDSSLVVSLVGEWLYRVAYNIKDHRPIPEIPGVMTKTTPTALFNGMIAPLIPYTIKGIIWYQGESNRNEAYDYRILFPLMVSDWRQRWQLGDFPFYYVQIAPYNYNSKYPIAAEVRESQLVSMVTIPNSGMVVTMDIGNVNDIHPRDKKTVGQRLSLWALANTYHKRGISYSGPLYKKMVIEGNKARIYFDYTGDGLNIKGTELTNFTIAGSDSVFLPAHAKIDGKNVLVWSEKVKKPIAVRYGWSNTAELNLYNSANLPASPFRTDVFPVSTEK